MADGHVHDRSAPRPAVDQPTRSPAGGDDGAHGDHGILAMLACCVAIGAAILLIALGPF